MTVTVEITEIRRKRIEVEIYPDEECNDIAGLAESEAENQYHLGYLTEDNIDAVIFNAEVPEC